MRISDWSSDVCSSDLADPLQDMRQRERPVTDVGVPARAQDRHHRHPENAGGDGEAHVDLGDQARGDGRQQHRSEEHTSELQSLMRISYAVFCLKKKKTLSHTSKYIPKLETQQY